MSAGLEGVRRAMAEYLEGQGVRAVTAWTAADRQELAQPVAVVSLRGCQAGPAGFQDYLGQRYNRETGQWEERYGKKVVLTLGLDLYGPVKGGGQALHDAFDKLAGALLQGGPEGLAVREFSCGETGYDTGGRLLKRSVQAVCETCVYRVSCDSGEFLDFELRGGLKT